MLDPRDRTLLFEALRPPEGYSLDAAIGTTYSLELTALLTAPLAFTIFDWEDRDGRPTADPLVLLEALRSHARRITIFSQVGRIAVPAQHQPLFAYLEESVVEVAAPHPDGVFHPKVWALRFTGEERPTIYRFLCLSRNLTFDRSWDTALVLEGELIDRQNAIADNHPLGDFFAALPGLAVRGVTDEVAERARMIEHEIRRVRFELPPGFDGVRFVPMGLDQRRSWPFPDNDRQMMVVSPFLSSSVLNDLSGRKDGCVLVSRQEALDQISPDVLARFTRLFTMADEAQPEDADEESAAVEQTGDESLRGLHAKLFVMDDGWRARLWTGSANATHAAFAHNVEFLVELEGSNSNCGVKAVLGSGNNSTSLENLLVPYTPPEERPPDGDPLRHEVEVIRGAIAAAGFRLVAREATDDEGWALALHAQPGTAIDPPASCEIVCRPVSLRAEHALPLDPAGDPLVTFSPLSPAALTTFVAFTVTVRDDGEQASAHFVLNLPLEGGPDDRRERILENVLKDRGSVLRFLMMLLADDYNDVSALMGSIMDSTRAGSSGAEVMLDIPLFEVMMRALHRDPTKLDRVARLVEDLSATEEGRRLFPEGFDEVWTPIWSARAELDGDCD